jgi:hypothetical protein
MLSVQVLRAHTRRKASKLVVLVKKSTDSGGAQSLDILAAKVRIVEAELTLEEKEVRLENGTSFMAEPNLNCKIAVVKNLVEPGMHEGARLYDRFKLKRDADGDWTFAKYSKLGNLIMVRYDERWFEDPNAEFEAADFEGFEFICRIQSKTDSKGKQLKGSVVDWQSMRQAGGTEERAITEKVAQAEAEEETDVSDIAF